MADDTILFQEQFAIRPGDRLPQFDSPGVEAFAVKDRHHNGRAMFALISPGDLPCRALGLTGFEPAKQLPLLWPAAAGIVDWLVIPASGGAPVWGRRPAILFDAPKGERFQQNPAAPLPPLSEQVVTRMLIAPAIAAIKELSAAGITHRAIRPGNLYHSSESKDSGLILGECLSMPPGYGQPALYEPIDQVGADPLARSAGTTADDLYALGVLAAQLHFGADPTIGWDSERVVRAKINQGTFVLLAGREKLAPSMAELLRGLLADRAADRWGVKHVEAWVKGQQSASAIASTQQRASRPILFAGQEHMSKISLAHAMAAHWTEALKLTDTPELENWLKRGFAEENAGEELNKIWIRSSSPGPGEATKDRAVSRLCMMLDPDGALRYRELRADLTGLGTLMSRAIGREDLAIQLGDMLRGRLPFVWIEGQTTLQADQIQARRVLEGLDKYLDRPGPGFGIERALYELEPAAPCRSPLIADYYVTSERDLLSAVDAVIPDLPAGTVPIDRHIAAFIGARLMRSTDREMGMLYTEKEEAEQAVAVLRLFAMVQHARPNSNLPRLCELLVRMLHPALEQFHNRAVRAEVERQMKKHSANCDLVALASLFEPEGPSRKQDSVGFTRARRAYSAAGQYADWLEAGGLTNSIRVKAIASRAAAGTAAFMTSAALTAYCVWAMW